MQFLPRVLSLVVAFAHLEIIYGIALQSIMKVFSMWRGAALCSGFYCNNREPCEMLTAWRHVLPKKWIYERDTLPLGQAIFANWIYSHVKWISHFPSYALFQLLCQKFSSFSHKAHTHGFIWIDLFVLFSKQLNTFILLSNFFSLQTLDVNYISILVINR